VDFYTTTGMKKFSVSHDDRGGQGKPRRRGNGADPARAEARFDRHLKRNQDRPGSRSLGGSHGRPDVGIATTLYKTTGDFIQIGEKKARIERAIASTRSSAQARSQSELGDQGTGVVVAQVVPPFSRTSVPSQGVSAAHREIRWERRTSPSTSLESYIGAKVLGEAIRRFGRQSDARRPHEDARFDAELQRRRLRRRLQPDDHNGSRFVELTAIGKRDGSFN